jgi:hypothetical protein
MSKKLECIPVPTGPCFQCKQARQGCSLMVHNDDGRPIRSTMSPRDFEEYRLDLFRKQNIKNINNKGKARMRDPPEEEQAMDEDVPSGMFTIVLPCSLCSLRMHPVQETDVDAIIEGFRGDVNALGSRCDRLEMVIQELQSRCSTQERAVDDYRQEIVSIKDRQGTLDTSYRGENFDTALE